MTRKKKQQPSQPPSDTTRTTRASETKLYAQKRLQSKGVVSTSSSKVATTSSASASTSSAASSSRSGLPPPNNDDSIPDNSSETADMLVDPPESDSQKKGKEKIKTPDNNPNVCNISFARPDEFSIFADLRTIPGSTTIDKCRSLDYRFRHDRHYVGNRVINFRGRLLMKAYFTDETAANRACQPSSSIHDSDPRNKISFTRFDRDFINQNITAQRQEETPNTLKATNLPPELTRAQLKDMFSEFGKLTRFSIVKGKTYNVGFFVYEDAKSLLPFFDKWGMFYKKDFIKLMPLGLTGDAQDHRNQLVVKMSGLPLFCFARDLSPIMLKLNAKAVHVPRLSNGLPGTTALFYFTTQKDKDDALAYKSAFSYQGRRVHITTLDKKSCFACGSAEHVIKSCKQRVLRYSRPKKTSPPKPTSTGTYHVSSKKSYASVVTSSKSDKNSNESYPNAPPPIQPDLSNVEKMLEMVLTEITSLQHNMASIRSELDSVKTQLDWDSQIQNTVNHFHDLAKQNNTAASDSCIRENFPILLSGFELLHKELRRLTSDMVILRASANLDDSDDEDYSEED